LRLENLEALRVEHVFPEKDQAIDYAQGRANFRLGEVRGNVERVILFNDKNQKL
jgi:hypothetical protein